MKLGEATSLLMDLIEIETISKAAMDPNGRWEIFQGWLARNPRWRKLIDSWIESTPDDAMAELMKYAAQRAELPLPVVQAFVTEPIKLRARSAIETIQTLYKERKEMGTNDVRPTTRRPWQPTDADA